MINIYDDNRFKRGIEYASSIIADVATFMDFSIAMLDYMGEDFPYCKSLYSALYNWPNLNIQFQNYEIWKNITDDCILREYHNFKYEQEKINREKEFKDNIDELQFLVKKYRTSEEFKKMLNFVGKFHYLAPYNAMLVEMQKPGSTFVFNGKRWKEYNRQPRLNAQQLITLIPFVPVQCMFNYSDTEQIPGTEEVSEIDLMKEWDKGLTKANGNLYHKTLSCLINNLTMYGIYLDDKFVAANTFGGYIMQDKGHVLSIPISKEISIGYNSAFSISINVNQPDVVKFHTLCHELGHLFCLHQFYNSSKRRRLSMKEREFEAETVAWLICKRHGIENPSEEYLASYAPQGVIPICSTEYIMKAVTEIEKMMTKPISINTSIWYKEDKQLKNFVSNYQQKESVRKNQPIQKLLFG